MQHTQLALQTEERRRNTMRRMRLAQSHLFSKDDTEMKSRFQRPNSEALSRTASTESALSDVDMVSDGRFPFCSCIVYMSTTFLRPFTLCSICFLTNLHSP